MRIQCWVVLRCTKHGLKPWMLLAFVLFSGHTFHQTPHHQRCFPARCWVTSVCLGQPHSTASIISTSEVLEAFCRSRESYKSCGALHISRGQISPWNKTHGQRALHHRYVVRFLFWTSCFERTCRVVWLCLVHMFMFAGLVWFCQVHYRSLLLPKWEKIWMVGVKGGYPLESQQINERDFCCPALTGPNHDTTGRGQKW